MWHEARKQERKIRGMIVDYRKRAERRQDFYEKIKADPTQFIQIHGRKCKIHLDPAVAAAGDGAAIIVPWQGNEDNLIDRFDVRAHLETIPIPSKQEEPPLTADEHHCNYERYRILAQNEFLGIAEEKFLYQLRLEEQFGATAHLDCDKITSKKKSVPRAAISYSYDTRDVPKAQIPQINTTAPADPDSDSEIDMDVTIDVNELDTSQAHELNSCGRNYGMMGNDFYSFLTKDADEAVALKMAKEVEQEKIMLSGRKSRRERRVQREKRLSGKPLSPPSYAAKEDTTSVSKGANEDEESDSHSHSSDSSEKITFITSFGGEDELQAHSKITINVGKPTDRIGGGRNDRRSFAPKLPNNGSKTSSLKLALGSISSGNINQSSSRKPTNNHSHHRSQCSRPSNYNTDRTGNLKERSPVASSRVNIPSNDTKVPIKDMISVTKNAGADLPAEKTVLKFPSQSNLPVREKNSSTDTSQTKANVDPTIPPIKRYYGRKRDDHSSSSDELTDYETNSPIKNTSADKNEENNSKESKISEESVGKSVSTPSLTHSSCFQAKGQTNADKQNLRDRLKRKMQTLLNKQYKADKKAELERTERQIQQQQEREDEMRELALKLRKRQRELRHKYGSPNSETSSSSQSTCDETASTSKWKNSEFSREKYRSRSRESTNRSYSHKDDESPQRGYAYRSRRSRSVSRHRSKDYGSNDHGSREYGSRDYGSKDYGGRDYGSKDYGNKDYRNKDYGSRDYGNKDSGSSRRNARVSRWDNDERERTRSPYSSHTQKYSNPPKRRFSRSRERLRARSRSPRR